MIDQREGCPESHTSRSAFKYLTKRAIQEFFSNQGKCLYCKCESENNWETERSSTFICIDCVQGFLQNAWILDKDMALQGFRFELYSALEGVTLQQLRELLLHTPQIFRLMDEYEHPNRNWNRCCDDFCSYDGTVDACDLPMQDLEIALVDAGADVGPLDENEVAILDDPYYGGPLHIHRFCCITCNALSYKVDIPPP